MSTPRKSPNSGNQSSRRDWLRMSAAGFIGGSMCRWFPAFADDAVANPQRQRNCILLWMSGGPSQLDTFDPKPEHENGGEFKPIDTSVPGIQICQLSLYGVDGEQSTPGENSRFAARRKPVLGAISDEDGFVETLGADLPEKGHVIAKSDLSKA